MPQRSILGPLLFLLYINDLADVSTKLFSLLFADDSNMFITGKDANELIESMNDEIINVVDWLRVNKLSLNLKKTHFIIFQKQKARINVYTELIVDGVKIEMKNSTKFLGVMLDKYLTFNDHIQYIKGKVSRGLGILIKCRKYFTQKTLITLYNSFIYPYLNFCTTVWGNTHESYLKPLIVSQNKAIRIVSGAKRRPIIWNDRTILIPAHTDPLYKKLNILKLSQIYIYSVQQFVFKYHHGMLPKVFNDFYSMNSHFHSHNTRSQNLYRPPLLRSSLGSTTVRATGVKFYNHFFNILDMNRSMLSYKAALKKYLIMNEVDSVDSL